MNTKEFARLCNVERRTLFYYDEIGLLKPQAVRENGYRSYDGSQLERMDIIKLYQACGCTLADIQAHIDLPVRERAAYLHQSMEALRGRIAELQEIHDYLREKEALYLESQGFDFQMQKLSFRYDRKPLDTEEHFFSYSADHFYTAIQVERGDADSMYTYREHAGGAYEEHGTFAVFYLSLDSSSGDVVAAIEQVLIARGLESDRLYIKLVTHLLSENGKSLMKVCCKLPRS